DLSTRQATGRSKREGVARVAQNGGQPRRGQSGWRDEDDSADARPTIRPRLTRRRRVGCLKTSADPDHRAERRGAGVPDGIRTRVTALKGRRPRPLDDRDVRPIAETGWRGDLAQDSRAVRSATRTIP